MESGDVGRLRWQGDQAVVFATGPLDQFGREQLISQRLCVHWICLSVQSRG